LNANIDRIFAETWRDQRDGGNEQRKTHSEHADEREPIAHRGGML